MRNYILATFDLLKEGGLTMGSRKWNYFEAMFTFFNYIPDPTDLHQIYWTTTQSWFVNPHQHLIDRSLLKSGPNTVVGTTPEGNHTWLEKTSIFD
jgi:hypothetical protein